MRTIAVSVSDRIVVSVLIGFLDVGICQEIKTHMFVEQTLSFAWST